MRRAAVAILTIAALGAAAGGAAAVVPTENDHNCAGFNVRRRTETPAASRPIGWPRGLAQGRIADPRSLSLLYRHPLYRL